MWSSTVRAPARKRKRWKPPWPGSRRAEWREWKLGLGDLYGAEYSTKSQVLNVILSAEGGIDGNVTQSVRRLYTGRVIPDVSADRH